MLIFAIRQSWLAASVFSALVVSSALAEPKKKETVLPKVEGRLIVQDQGDLFSPDGVKKAKSILAEVMDRSSREMFVVTYKELPEAKKKSFEKLDNSADKQRFFEDWIKEELKGQQARGVVVFICRSPGHVHVLADKQIRDKGFGSSDEKQLVTILLEKFKEARDKPEEERAAIRDKGLLNAAEYVRDAYKKMVR